MFREFRIKKTSVVLATALFLSISLVGWGMNDNTQGDIDIINSPAELREEFVDLKDLKKEAELTIEAKVISQETIVYEKVPFTISQVEVLKKFKGNLNKGSIINVIETGGIFEPQGKNGETFNKVEMQLNGVSTLKPDDHVFLFLEGFFGPQIEEAYIPLGAYQGKFKVDKKGFVEQQSNAESNAEYKLKNFNATRLEDFQKVLHVEDL